MRNRPFPAVGHWALWRQPGWLVGYLLVGEATALGAVGWSLTAAGPAVQPGHWPVAALLLAANAAHLALSRRGEERRRDGTARGCHLDLTALWTFAAVLALPLVLVLPLVLAMRLQLWSFARRPAYRYTYASCVIVLSTLLAQRVLDAFGAVPYSAGWLAAAALAALCYALVQAVLVGGAVLLSGRPVGAGTVLGTPADNLTELLALALAVVTAILLAVQPLAVLAMVPVAVAVDRLTELRRLRLATATDPLTGLASGSAWRLGAGDALAGESGAVSLLLVELDHRRELDRRYGRPAGDALLRAVAGELAALLPTVPPGAVPLAGRWDQRRLVALLPDADRVTAVQAAERLRAAVAARSVTVTDRRGRPVRLSGAAVTVSVGAVTAQPADRPTSPDQLLSRAEPVLRTARAAGRNCVRVG